MAKHIELGKKGEKIAYWELKRKGYQILATNWTYYRWELDIIAYKDNMLVFVEVKTRSSDRFLYPEQAVTEKKKKSISKASTAYIDQNNYEGDARFDIVSIVIQGNTKTIYHIEDAFFFYG